MLYRKIQSSFLNILLIHKFCDDNVKMYLAILTEKIVLNSFLWERFDVYIIEKILPEGSVP